MGIFNPFSYWPLAPTKGNSADDTTKATKDQSGNSWEIVDSEQMNANVSSLASTATTPSPTEPTAVGTENQTGNRLSLRPKLSLDTTVGRHTPQNAGQQRPVGVTEGRNTGETTAARSSKQSWKGSKRLAGLKSILRVRKGQEQLRQQFPAESSLMELYGQGPVAPSHGDLGDLNQEDQGDQDICDSATKESQYGDPLEVPETSNIPPVPPVPSFPPISNSSISPIPPIPSIPQLLQLSQLPKLPEMNRLYDCDENNDTRRVSDKSSQSRDSNATSSTVVHRALVCPVDQIPLTDRGYRYENPFEDLHGLCGIEKQGPPPLPEHSSLLVPELPDDLSRQSLSIESSWKTWSADIDQHEALKMFNDMAYELCLRPVPLDSQSGYLKDTKPETMSEEKMGVPGRRSAIIQRIRTMRSNIQLRSQSLSPEPEHRRVRRMKTFASLSSRPEPFVTLKGRSLETLSRLGGYTVLKLPGDFVPASLKLPVCIGSTALFLKNYTRKVPNIFFDPGDVKAGARTYEHFVSQVLQAEREEEKIQMTMRRSQIPPDPLERVDHEASRQRPSYVLSNAWVFKALLAGIPDGILGSEALYQALVDISYGRSPRLSSEGEPRRPGSCLEGLTTWENVRTKAIALAMLALTSKMHLDLICGVFGLFAVLLHETQREVENEWVTKVRTREQRPSWAAGLLDVNRVSRVLGPLLTNRDEYDSYESQCGRVPSLLTGERVVRMLVEDWRGVSRQLRWWGRCGCPPMRVVIQTQDKRDKEVGQEEQREGPERKEKGNQAA